MMKKILKTVVSATLCLTLGASAAWAGPRYEREPRPGKRAPSSMKRHPMPAARHTPRHRSPAHHYRPAPPPPPRYYSHRPRHHHYAPPPVVVYPGYGVAVAPPPVTVYSDDWSVPAAIFGTAVAAGLIGAALAH